LRRPLLLVVPIVLAAALSVTPTVTTISEAASTSGEPVIGAVGDMACDQSNPSFHGGAGTTLGCGEARTSDAVLGDASLDAVLGLGDYQYDCGDLADYEVSYNPTWGRLDGKMEPAAGNHEYKTGRDVFGAQCPSTNASAQNYFAHFGDSAHPETHGHFSFDLGTWHLIALNANCSKQNVGGCGPKTAQTTWLKQDLASTLQPCVLAFWHQPRFSGDNVAKVYATWWNVLYAAHADVVLNGHLHNYQRFAPLNPAGTIDRTNGITEYIIGTGGENLVGLSPSAPRRVVGIKTFGYMRMTLSAATWTAEFNNTAGTVLDTSTGSCHV
jgi:hypothetical protein